MEFNHCYQSCSMDSMDSMERIFFMKLLIRIATGSLIAIMLLAAQVFAQANPRARGLFRSGQSDAMNVLILKKEGDRFAPVDAARNFQKGDQIKVTFESNFDGFVYVINVTPGGKKRVLFPYEKESNRVARGQRYELPSVNVFVFDEEKGTEIVRGVM